MKNVCSQFRLISILIFLSAFYVNFHLNEASCPLIPVTINIPIDLNTNFSTNACIIVNEYSIPDCNLAPPDRIIPNTTISPCPGSLAPTRTAAQLNGTQTIFTTIEDALQYCPYDPVLIQFTGTLYRTSDVIVYYNQSKDLIIQGIPTVVVTPSTNLSSLVLVNVSYFNTTTNQTEITQEEQTVITVQPGYNTTYQPVLVGVMNLQMLYTNISVSLIGYISEGCGTEDGFFYSKTCNETCRDISDGVCSGEWFEKADNISYTGVCQGTGAFFNNTNRLVIQNNSNPYPQPQSAWFNYDTAFTIEAWVNPEVQAQPKYTLIIGNYRVSNGPSGSSGYGFVYNNDGDYSAYIRFIVVNGPGNRNVHCVTTIPTNKWTHLAGRFINGAIYLYQNGVEICTDSSVHTSVYYVANRGVGFQIGGGVQNFDQNDNPDTFNHFMGLIDEVRVWNYTRSADQIYSNFLKSYPVPNTEYGLAAYVRFDWGADGSNFLTNYGQLQPLTVWSFNRNTIGPIPAAIYDCFCLTISGGTCVPTNGDPGSPAGALTNFSAFVAATNYEFIHGKLIDPNGIYGFIWLAGLTYTFGPSYNLTQYFYPGEYMVWPDWEEMTFMNMTIWVPSLTSSSLQFIPGAIPSLLPPLGFNPWASLDFFVPGWFFNGGLPPYSANNFFPGIFMPQPADVPTPTNCRPDQLVFVPGIWYPNGTWEPFSTPDPNYDIPITILGGVCFNATTDTDNCTLPALPVVQEAPQPVIEVLLGCNISSTSPVPTHLNRTAQDPCFQLMQIRALLPAGTTSLDPEEILGCTVGPNDPEPVHLNRTARDPCFILRDIRKNIPTNALTCNASQVHVDPVYIPCATNQNLYIQDMTFKNYYGMYTICQWACEENVEAVVQNSNFENILGSALWLSGMNSIIVSDTNLCPCGGINNCSYFSPSEIAEGPFEFYNIRHCAVSDLLPHVCYYDITPYVRCDGGQLMCMDVASTLDLGCATQTFPDGTVVYDNECAVYEPCTCGAANTSVTLPDGSVVNMVLNTASVEVLVTLLAPDLLDFLNGTSDSLFLPCTTQNITQSFNYSCQQNVTMTVVVGNITMNTTTLVTTSCTISMTFFNGTNVSCPCSADFNASLVTNKTGSAAASDLGLYTNCMWDIPNGLPGEECVDGVVWCPYAGGTLGSGTPPPPPPGVCNAGTAVIPCSECVGGQVYYEGTYHPCPSTCTTAPPNGTTITYFNLACQCTDFYLIIPCERNVTCFDYNNTCNGTGLCSYVGNLTFDGTNYPCLVQENQTLCFGFSFAPSYVGTPPDGYLAVPCDNTYQVPSPGPCSCLGSTTSSNNITLSVNATSCNYTIDPNCTATTNSDVSTGDTSLQFQCNAQGKLICRCDGFQAVNIPNLPNFTMSPDTAAIVWDNFKASAYFFQRNIVTQQLPIGVHLIRFTYDIIPAYPTQYLHFYSGWATMHEFGRWGASPYVTGTIWDWADGGYYQWNLRTCSTAFPPTSIYDDCQQYRPGPWNPNALACVVDQQYTASQTADFGVTRFNRIQKALNLCPYTNIIIRKSVNPYEEVFIIYRDNMFLVSYDMAVIVGSPHQLRALNPGIRHIRFVHPGTNDYPIFQPTLASYNNFDSAFQNADAPGQQPDNVHILNCYINGHSVDKSGVMIGAYGNSSVFNYNTVTSFKTRAIFIYAPYTEFLLNTFTLCPGRVVRVEYVDSYKFDENLLIDCPGIDGARHVENVLFWANGDIGGIPVKRPIGEIIFTNLTADEYIAAFDVTDAIATINPNTLGCNPTIRTGTTCSIRGNRHVLSRSDERPDFSTICYRLIAGNITTDYIRDNFCSHAQIGMDTSYTVSVGYQTKTELFINNPGIRTQDTRNDPSDSADFTFRAPGSLVSVGCYFPNCWYADQPFPIMEVNPRCDIAISLGYGLYCMDNLTIAQRYALPLSMLNVTSGQSRVRLEQIVYRGDVYAVGYYDPPCCAPPVIYGSAHTWNSGISVHQKLEFRYRFIDDPIQLDGDKQNLAEKMILTLRTNYAQDVRFYECIFNGMYQMPYDNIYIMQIYLDPVTGIFVMENSHVYNWFHLPDSAHIGTMETANGDEKVIVILEDDTIFRAHRVPVISGIHIIFQPWKTQDQKPYALHTTRNPDKILQSLAIINNNLFETLDGLVLRVTAAASWEINNNTILDCGVRDRTARSVFYLEGNKESLLTYNFNYNNFTNNRPYLYPYVGNQQNERVRFSCLYMSDMRFPNDVSIKGNTVALNDNVLSSSSKGVWGSLGNSRATQEEIDAGDYGVFGKDGPLIAGGSIYRNQQEISGTTLTAEEVLRVSSADPAKIISSGNMRAVADDGVLPTNEFVSFDVSLATLVEQNSITIYALDDIYGYPIAFRSNLPFNVLLLTLDASLQNGPLFPEFQPELYPLRAVSAMNGGLYNWYAKNISTNGPGFQGILADIIQCAFNKDTVRETMRECAVCNDGCPAYPPDSCIVDAVNKSFVPGNPYFNTWLFKTLNSAIRNCTDPNRVITIVNQNHPWNEVWNLDQANWTIRTLDGATIKPHTPITFKANNITLDGFTFIDNTARTLPTITTFGSTSYINITIKNCNFRGSGSAGSAVAGNFQSVAIVNTTFINYKTILPLININSTCGIFYFDNNTIHDVYGNAVYASSFDALTFRENQFLDCGGKYSLSCVYVKTCNDTLQTLIFSNNAQYRDGYVEGSYAGGNVAAYWIDGIPLFKTYPTTKGNVTIDLTNNKASGLDIGMRVTNVDDLSTLSGAFVSDPKATLNYICRQRNFGIEGSFHGFVWLVPENDNLLEANPVSYNRYFDDPPCLASTGSQYAIITLGIIVVVFMLWFTFTCAFRVPNSIDLRVYTGRFCCRWY
jgi:hypothetical protein